MFPEHGVWPVRVHRSLGEPVISDSFGRNKRGGRGHLGVDIMYKRPSKGEFHRPVQTPWFRMPNGRQCIACGDGKVWSVENSSHGKVIRLDLGFPWLAVYRHITTASVSAGDRVRAGDDLGVIGFDPSNGDSGINHLHFELWDTSIGTVNTREARSVDPGPFMVNWEKLGDDAAPLVGGSPGVRGPHSVADADGSAVDAGNGGAVGIDLFSGSEFKV